MSETATATRPRKVHVPFDEMTCPVKGCNVHGAVPGVKRHVTTIHEDVDTTKIDWPPNRTGPRAAMAEAVAAAKTNEDLSASVLRDIAKERGVPTKGLKKAELIAALQEAPTKA